MRKLFIILAFLPFALFLQGQNTGLVRYGSGIWTFQGGAVTYITYNPLSLELFERWSPSPSDSSKFAINQLIDTIDYYGVYDKADVYRIYAANSEISANLNIKSTSFTATPTNSPTFNINEGYKGDGVSAYIKENYNPAVDADSFQLNNATIHMYNNTNDLAFNDMLFAMKDATDWIELFYSSSDQLRVRLNALGSFTNFAKQNILGGITITRNNADSVYLLRDNGVYVGGILASTAIPNQADGLYTLAWNNNGAPGTQNNNLASFMYIGSALTQLQSQKLYEAEQRYLDYFGKSPIIVTTEIEIDPEGGGDYTSISDALVAITDNSYWNRYNLNISDTLYEFGLGMKDYVNLIGDDTSTAKIIGYLPADTTEAAIIATSTIDCDYINFDVRNIHISIQNGRYTIHSDANYGVGVQDSKGVTQNFIGCKIVHEGNIEADAFYGHEVWATTDALGMGFSFNMTVNVDSCYTESKGTSATTSRGIAQHAAISNVYRSTMNISNTICKTSTTNALRVGMLFDNQDEYYFDNVSLFGALLIDGSGTYTDNTTQIGTNPIILNGSLIAD